MVIFLFYFFFLTHVLISALLDLALKNCPKDVIVIKDLKKTIIKTLLESHTSKDIFSETQMSRMKNNGIARSNVDAPQPDVLVENMAT